MLACTPDPYEAIIMPTVIEGIKTIVFRSIIQKVFKKLTSEFPQLNRV